MRLNDLEETTCSKILLTLFRFQHVTLLDHPENGPKECMSFQLNCRLKFLRCQEYYLNQQIYQFSLPGSKTRKNTCSMGFSYRDSSLLGSSSAKVL